MISKFIPGVLIGAVLAGIAFLLFDKPDEDRPPPPEEVLSSDGGEIPGNSSESISSVATDAVPNEAVSSSREVAPTANEATGEAEASPPVMPVSLRSELEWIRENANFKYFESQLIDPEWSQQTETELLNYFSQHPEITSIYGMPNIHCRENQCMATFIMYGYPDYARNHPEPEVSKLAESPIGPGEIFRADLQVFFDDPISDQFHDEYGAAAAGRVEDGVATLYWPLGRRVAD